MTTDAQTLAVLEMFGEDMLQLDEKSQAHLAETFSRVNALLQREDQGWVQLFGSGDRVGEEGQFGLTLESLKDWSTKIRESIVGAPWMRAGFNRRQNYIWEGGIRYGNIPAGGTRGKQNIQKIIDRPSNQFHFFGHQARRAREECLFADGVAFWIGSERTKDLEAIPLRQITGQLLEPNGLGYAIAYKREWTEYNYRTGESDPHTRWYFTDRFVDMRVETLTIDGMAGPTREDVDQDHVIFDQHANSSTGLVYGSPDAVAAFVWNGIARDAVMDGRAMQKALATFALKATAKSPQSTNGALKLAGTNGAGNTAVLGQANDLTPLASAGKGYDFTSIRFLVAMVASALDISVIHMTANPGDAGSSYGSAQTLDLPTRLAMEARRAEHIDLDERVLRWMGVEAPDVQFKPFDAGDEIYRSIQGLILAYQQDIYTRQESRDMIDDLLALSNGSVPSEDQRPSVLLAKAMAKIEEEKADRAADRALADQKAAADAAAKAQGAAGAPAANAGSGSQVASPNQGRSNGTGGAMNGGQSSNDIRRD